MGRQRIKAPHWKGAHRVYRMKRLIFASEDSKAMEACWNGFMVGSRPEAGEWKTAIAVEDKLTEASIEIEGLPVKCQNCGHADKLTGADVPDSAQHLTKRALKPEAGETLIDLEEAEHGFLCKVIRRVQPPQSMVRHFGRLLDILDQAETVKLIPKAVRPKIVEENVAGGAAV